MKFESFLICDDIRTEINNKVSLIGVYDDRIVFLPKEGELVTWPNQMQIGIYAKLKFELADDLEMIKFFNFKVCFNNSEIELAKGDFPLEKISKVPIMKISVVYPNFTFSEKGTFTIRLEFLDKNEMIIYTISPENSIQITDST
jgi:hypothetical protein